MVRFADGVAGAKTSDAIKGFERATGFDVASEVVRYIQKRVKQQSNMEA